MRVGFDGSDITIARENGDRIGKIVCHPIVTESDYGQSWFDGEFFVTYKNDPDGILLRRFGPVPTLRWALREMNEWCDQVTR